jgi:hypothetical protein
MNIRNYTVRIQRQPVSFLHDIHAQKSHRQYPSSYRPDIWRDQEPDSCRDEIIL